jgi:hypothetical protein
MVWLTLSLERPRILTSDPTETHHGTWFWPSSVYFPSSQPVSLRCILMLSSHLLVLLSGQFPRGLPFRVTLSVHHNIDFTSLTVLLISDLYKSWSVLSHFVLHLLLMLSVLGQNIDLNTGVLPLNCLWIFCVFS